MKSRTEEEKKEDGGGWIAGRDEVEAEVEVEWRMGDEATWGDGLITQARGTSR
jgi:hypothetical protein